MGALLKVVPGDESTAKQPFQRLLSEGAILAKKSPSAHHLVSARHNETDQVCRQCTLAETVGAANVNV